MPEAGSGESKTALITGITGQDGSYLAELLLAKGYRVHGIIRRASSFNTARIEHLYDDPHDAAPRIALHYGDMLDAMGLRRTLSTVRPDEVYNLAAQSHVKTSFDLPIYSVETVAMGTLHLLEALRDYRDVTGHNVRLYQACSSEMFGSNPPPQNERTPFRPQSPYACAKVYAYHQCVNYRDAYGMWITCGILFNHESPRRGETFVTRKIAKAAARISHGLQDAVYLGNLKARRDWGYAGDYVDAMWRMVQHTEPDDFVVATGVSFSVEDFASMAFRHIGLDAGQYIRFDPRYLRPCEVDYLKGDASKARSVLGWEPTWTLANLSGAMVDAEMVEARWEAERLTRRPVVA